MGGGEREGRHASQTLKRVGGALTGAIGSTSHMTNCGGLLGGVNKA